MKKLVGTLCIITMGGFKFFKYLIAAKLRTKQEFNILQLQGSAIWMCAKSTLSDAEKSISHN